MYDFSKPNLLDKTKFFSERYNESVKNKSIEKSIKWSRDLKKDFDRGTKILHNPDKIALTTYRPYIKKYLFYERLMCDVLTENHFRYYGKELAAKNPTIILSSGQRAPFAAYASYDLPNLDIFMPNGTKILPFYTMDCNGQIVSNITDWALNRFVNQYGKKGINKEAIFQYIYAVLSNPSYKKKYELNLKREFPRIPFYEDFNKWAAWGSALMDLHINYETVKPYPLERRDVEIDLKAGYTIEDLEKGRLKANKADGIVKIDSYTDLMGIPATAWEYKLGNRSALEWILDQYEEGKAKDPTIAEKFDTYKFSDYKEQVIDLLKRVCTVSVETMKIIEEMKTESK